MIFTSPTISLSRVQDGQSGQPGVSSYVHIKYSDDMATFTANSGETIGKYIGMYTDHIEQDSMTFSDYAWSQLIADDAYTVVMTNESFSFATDLNRVPLSSQSASTGFIILHGTDPVTNYTIGTITSPTGITSSVSNNVVTFTVDTTTALTADYGQIMIPITVDGVLITKYASWSVSKKGEQGIQGPAGSTGPQGTSVSNVTPEYRLSDSSTELTGSGTGYSWSPTKPDIPSGKYLWARNANTLSNGTTVYSDAVCDVVTSGLVFDVNKNSNAITSKVWESDITTSINTYDGSTAQAIRDRVTQTESNITGITSRVSDVETTVSGDPDDPTDGGLVARMTTAESSITQNADNIALMVSVDGTTSSLTLTQDMLSAMTSQFVIKDPAGSQTIISGGKISANSITTAMLATDAIKSSNYQASPNAQSPYSAVGTFLDLSTGSLYMPQFGVDGTTGAAYFNGQVNADSGKFGDDNSYWNIETVIDYNATSHAALVGAGNPYLQTGNWQISDNAVATRKYVSTSETAGTASYYKDTATNTFYDVGMKIPTSFTVGNDSNEDRYHRAFFYQRSYTGSTVPALDSSWNYPFIVDNEGRVYCTDLIIIGGGSGTTYLPLAGGTITGNLSVNGSFTTNLMLRTNLGSTSASYLTGNAQTIVDHGVTGTLGIGNGGTGKTTWTANGIVYASASNTLSQLGTGTSGQLLKSNGNAAPGWVNQSTIAAGSATNDSDGNAINTTYRKLSDDTFDTIDVTELNAGELIVTGVGRFSNGLYGNLSGNADTASSIESNRAFTVGITTKNVDWSSAVSFSKADISADATQSANGWMSINDKKKLDGIATGAQVNSITGVKGNAEASYRTGQVNITATNIGLGNLTNNKQIKGLASGTTSGHFVSWGSDGYTVADSGYTAGQVVKSLASDNDGKIVLTYLDGTTSDPIEVKIIGSSGSSVSYADALNVNGTAVGSATQPVYINNQGKPALANQIPMLNGASSSSSFYAPTSVGTSGQVLQSSGSGAPSWVAQSTLAVGSATKATQDSDGNAINSTYLKLAGGTMTGDLMLQKTTSIADNLPAQLTFSVIQTDNNKTTSSGYIAVYDDHDNATNGVNMVIRSAGNMYIGGGESPSSLYSAIGTNSTSENMYITADSYIYLEANANTIANRKGFVINTSHELIPVLAETSTNNVGSIGTATYKLANIYATTLHGELDGNAATATKATQDSNGNAINTTYAKLSGATFTGAVTGTSFAATDYISANNSASNAGGVNLYNRSATMEYAIMFRATSNQVKHGYVQGDWATYLTMGGNASNIATRGWIFKDHLNSKGVASISAAGNAVFNGSVTVGGNAANTSGCRLEFDDTLKCLDFLIS